MCNSKTCTWDENSDCINCKIQSELACKWDKKILKNFHLINWSAIVPAIFGMVIIGHMTNSWWILYGYIAYFSKIHPQVFQD